MPKPNFQFEKRQRELEKKKRKEEKRLKKLGKTTTPPAEDPAPQPIAAETTET